MDTPPSIVHVPFNGKTIDAIAGDNPDAYLVALKPLCENLAVDFSSQRKRLSQQPWAVVVMTTTTGSDGKNYKMLCIDRQTLVMWLATIDTSRLKSEQAKQVVTRYQLECANALDSYFSNGFAVTPAAAEKIISDPDTFIRVLTEMKEQRERADRLAAENAEMKPKALFADAVAASDGTCLVGELAKMLTQAGYKIGQNRLFEKLRQEGYLGTTGSHRNVPKQRYVEMGLFRIKETAITHGDGHVTLARTTKITGKGQRYFLEKYAKVA